MATIFKTAGGTWRAQIRRKGEPAISQNFPTKQAAQVWARAQEHKHDMGVRVPAGLRITFDQLVDTYLERMRHRRPSPSKLTFITALRRAFAGVRLDELSKDKICAYARRKHEEGVQPSTVSTYLTHYSIILRYAGAMMDAEDATAVALTHYKNARLLLMHEGIVGGGNERDRRPSEEELRAMFQWWQRNSSTLRVPMEDIVKLAICTCMRQGEIVKITDADFHADARMLRVRDRKDPKKRSGNDTLMPLLVGPVVLFGKTIDPVEILKYQLKRGRFFPYLASSISQRFTVTTQQLGIEDLHFHDLRHDGISRLFEAGYQIPEVALVSGHKSWKHLQRYTNIKPSTLHRVR